MLCIYITLPLKLFLFSDKSGIKKHDGGLSTSKALIIVAIIFSLSLVALGLLYKQFPELEE